MFMDDMEMREQIDKYIKEICHYSQMQVFATSAYQKRFLQYQIDETANELADFFLVQNEPVIHRQQLQQPQSDAEPKQPEQSEQPLQGQPVPQQPIKVQPSPQQPAQPQVELKQPTTQTQTGELVFTIEELAKNDGSRGNNSYVAVDGNVYDVTMLGGWAGGTHFGLFAGKDLTSEFTGCHRGMLDVLQRAPKIGTLKRE